MDKEKIGGVAETMLQTLYARAKESGKPNHKIFDAKAIEIVEQMAYDFIQRLYKETLQRYKAENILFCGSSSGAYLALGLVSHINAMGEGLPIPSKIYASSPGTCFDKQEEWDAACKPILSGLEPGRVLIIE